MDKGLTAPKWVLIVQPKIPQMHQNFSDQFLCSNPKDLDFNEKRLHWGSVVRDCGVHAQQHFRAAETHHTYNNKSNKRVFLQCRHRVMG